MKVWCKGNEPVRVGSKVLCNYEEGSRFDGVLEPVGIVIGHDGSIPEAKPWIVLTRFLNSERCDFNFFLEGDLKVLGGYDSPEEYMSAIEGIVGGAPPQYLNMLLSDMHGTFGKVHEELEK